jgi:(R,R)-butanediol dehydrogenase / meso-butanediol dehydrogenase / diacetyl reductase
LLAAALIAPRTINIKELEKPSCGPDSVLVKIDFTAICGTDVTIYKTGNVNVPRILGHETAGTISEIGVNVTNFKLGDRVIINPVSYCGKCELCCQGKEALCPSGGLRGRELDGFFAEYVLADKTDIYKIPEGVSSAEATQIQTLTTVYHSQRRLDVKPGKGILVIGLGVTGLLHVMLAKASGAIPVIAAARSQWKLDLARELGADEILKLPDIHALDKLKTLTGGTGPDAVIDAAGTPETFLQSIEWVAPSGNFLSYGTLHEPVNNFSTFQTYFKEINIISSRAASHADWMPSINLVKGRKIDLKRLITHQLPLRQIQDGFKMMEDSSSRAIRIAIAMH